LRPWALSALALAAIGCKDLPDIPTGVCGNQVVEPTEDCDGFSPDGVPCRRPGSLDECRLDCSPDETGVAATCPSGWGCFGGTVCRPATGEFVASGSEIPGNAWSLLTGDFDGDGHGDVVSLERPAALGVTKARVHYFGDPGVPTESFVFERAFGSPTVSNISRDARSDIAYSFGNVGVLLGEPDRTLLGEAYASYFLGGAPARAVFVSDERIDDSAAIAVFAEIDGTHGIYVADRMSTFLRRLVEVPTGVEGLASVPEPAELFEDEAEFPGREFVVAYRGATELSVYSLSEQGPNATLLWRQEPYVEIVELDPPVTIERGLVLADFDGDDHLDILIATAEGPYLAHGEGTAFTPARPLVINVLDDSVAAGTMPLAGGDMTGDGRADFVFPEGLALSVVDPATGEEGYVTTRERFGAAWTEARFGDLNADGWLDAVCASNAGLDIDFFNGTGTIGVNAFSIPTDRPTEHLAIGDLDGDLVNDVAFVELRGPTDDSERISIAFGRSAGAPEDPRPAAHLEDVEQIVSFVGGDSAGTIANLVALFAQTVDTGDSQHALGFLIGSSERTPLSSIELTTFSADGSVNGSASLALAVGSFRNRRQTDLLPFALALEEDVELIHGEPGLWLVQDITSKNHGPESIGWNLDPRTTPFGGPSGPEEFSARIAAKDLDGDGLDEVVFVAPNESGAQCIVNVAGVVGDPPVVELRDVVALESPCYETSLQFADLDLDEAFDIVLLAGALDRTRGPVVLWNDGNGDFAGDGASPISLEGESAHAFTTFRSFDGETTLAYVTDLSVRLLRPFGGSRSFEDLGLAAELNRGTGIVAADLDGDGIVDLAVADSGSVRILRAELAP
jgi:hypothetical protein